jgi:hypothetical protein
LCAAVTGVYPFEALRGQSLPTAPDCCSLPPQTLE